MKTSLELDDNLYREARIRAVQTGTTLRALVEKGLRSVLAEPLQTESDRTAEMIARIRDVQDRYAALPSLCERLSDDELVGYDDCGLPNLAAVAY